MDNQLYVLDKNGEPKEETDLLKWGKWMEIGNRIVKQEYIGDYFVSTVFLGLNHNFEVGEPLLFETKVFNTKDYSRHLGQERYATKKEALEGHKLLVKKYKCLKK